MAEISFSIRAGALVRGQIRRQLRQFCHDEGFTLHLDEDKGFLCSLFLVKIELPDRDVNRTYDALTEWAERQSNAR